MRELTIRDAVKEYMSLKWHETSVDYSALIDDITKTHGEKFKRVSGKSGLLEFFNVRLAIDSNRLWDIFEPQTAIKVTDEIVKGHLLKAVEGETNKNILSSDFYEYLDLTAQDLEESKVFLNSKIKSPPLDKVTRLFLRRLLGDNIAEFEVAFNKDKIILSPLIIAHCCNHLIHYNVSWLAVKGKLILN